MSSPFSSARSSVSTSSSSRSSLLSSTSLFSNLSTTSSRSSSSSIVTTSSIQSTATHLTFLAFPPSNVPATTLETVSCQTAQRLLHDHKTYLTLNPAVTACHEIPSASFQEAAKLDSRFQPQYTDLRLMPTTPSTSPNLTTSPTTLSQASTPPPSAATTWPDNISAASPPPPPYTRPKPVDPPSSPDTGPWRFYLLTHTLPLPLLSIPTTTTYRAAARTTAAGLETIVQAPGHATLRSVVRIEARGTDGPGLAGESLWLVEEAEVRCWKGMRWYVEMVERERREGVHEMFRVAWDEGVRSAVEERREWD